MKTKAEIAAALEAAWKAPYVAGPGYGCGRAYVCVSGLERAEVNALAAAAKKANILFLRKAYGTGGNALYVGYDNADGRATGKARAVAESLKGAGFKAYDDAVAD